MALQIYRSPESVIRQSISRQTNTTPLMITASQLITPPKLAFSPQATSTNTISSTDSVELMSKNKYVDTSFMLPDIRDTGVKPALSLSQLVTMALVQAPDRTLSTEGIYKWINDTFKYYRDLFLEHNLSGSPNTCPWLKSVDDILHEFDFPTKAVLTNDTGLRFHLPLSREWFILTSSFEKGDIKPFRLLDLPFELRLMIYVHTLRRALPPKSGWVIDPNSMMKKQKNHRKLNRKSVFLTTTVEGDWQLRTPRSDKVLALLLVNRQVNQEAKPVFYQTNYFSFESPMTLSQFLRAIPSHREFVRNIVLNYNPPAIGHQGGAACKLLATTKIRNMILKMDEMAVLQEHGFDKVEELPGLKHLAYNLRGLDSVIFQGPCSRAKILLKNLVNDKRGDSLDTDEKVEKKMEQDKKTRRQEALKRVRNIMKCRKQEQSAERNAQGDKVKLENKVLREQKKAKSMEKSKEKQLLQQQEFELKPSTPRSKGKSYETDIAKIKQIKTETKKRIRKQDATPLQNVDSDSEWEESPQPKKAMTVKNVLAVKAKSSSKPRNNDIFCAQPKPKANAVKSCTGNARKGCGAAKPIAQSVAVVIDSVDEDMSDAFVTADEETD